MKIKAKRVYKKATKNSYSCVMPGVWRAVTYCQGVAVIFHGPRACTHLARTMDIGAHYRSLARNYLEPYKDTVPLVSTMLTQQEAVFGGEEKLKACLSYVMQTYSPHCVVIANSCVTGVIGDDITSIAEQAKIDYKIPILAISHAGFLDGEFFDGFLATAKQLVENFMFKKSVEENSVVLLGDAGGPNGGYAKELAILLKYFDLHIKAHFPTYTKLENLQQIPASSLNIVLGWQKNGEQNIEKLAEFLNAKFGTPYYADIYPFGWDNTVKWLQGLGKLLKKEQAAQLAIAEQRERRTKLFEKAQAITKDKCAVLCLGMWASYYQPFWIMQLIKLLAFDFTVIIFLDGYPQEDKAGIRQAVENFPHVKFYSEQEGASIIEQSDIIFTTQELNMPDIKQLYLSMQPAAGVQGEVELIANITRLLYRRGNRRGIVYA